MQRIILFLILAFSPLSVWSQGLEDWYAYFSEWSGIDKNAGQTTFLTLIIPSGGIYQGMGTAYTAVAKDSGYLDANPAGSALLQDTELSLFHHDWISESRMEGAVYTIRYKDFGLGAGAKLLYLPITSIDSWGERESVNGKTAKGYYTEFIGTGNVSVNLFNSYYFSGLTLGGNAKLAYRGVPEVVYPGQSALTLIFDAGVMTKFNFLKFYPSRTRNLSLGATLKNLGLPVQGDPLPTALVVGIAYNPIRPLTVALDGTLPMVLSKDFSLGNFGSFALGSTQAETPSLALGMDLVMTNFFSLQGGLRLKEGATRISAGASIALEKVTFNINYVLDLATQAQAFDRLSLEAKFNLGDLGRRDSEERARILYLQGMELFAKGNISDAIKTLEESVLLNPQFNPAQEILQVAKDTQDVQKAMKDLTTIEQPTPNP